MGETIGMVRRIDMDRANPSHGELRDRVLNLIQCGFPLCTDPYAAIGEQSGCEPAEAHAIVCRLREERIIRRIGGTFAPHKLGYISVLACARVAAGHLDDVAAFVSAFPGVTHNYERNDAYNLWFTVGAPGQEALQDILGQVAARPGVLALHPLPALRTFKIQVDFKFGEGAADREKIVQRPGPDGGAVVLDAADRQLIRAVCGDIGAGRRPFAELAERLALGEEQILERLSAYLRQGAMRRFGAMLRHQLAGFVANGMSAWDVPDDRVAEVGARIAAVGAVSHCYERPRFDDWVYNIYGMIHGGDEQACLAVAAGIARETGIGNYRVLFSSREFKKTSMVYFAEVGQGSERLLRGRNVG